MGLAIKLLNTINQSQASAADTTVTGDGWCAGVGVDCWNGNTGLSTPYMFARINLNERADREVESSRRVRNWRSCQRSIPR